MGNCCYGQNHHIDLDSQVLSPPISKGSNDDVITNVSNVSNVLNNNTNVSNVSNVSNTSFDDDDVVDFDKIIDDYQKSHPRRIPRSPTITEPPVSVFKRQNHIIFYEKEHNKPQVIL